ncbi:AraC family transcriptional regulator [Marinitenerispora sediminis]|uniref:AraC family transcriptional regulator n=1 Tax=Marinitenerispora sediminis TaxID=1931232 RepID=UPI000DF2A98D|nr:AraC family ligand binding domain-containing protein [Marinitenerispora sediminis]RCV61378.1 AraC family transcriptional regulator [Marinitenerispora sediminis]
MAGEGGPAARESARYWRHPGLPDVELLRASFVRQRFDRHVHEEYAIGVIEAGIEEYRYRGELHRAGAGGVVVVEPGEVHTGHAGLPEGWRYRMLYPEVPVVAQIARELGRTAPPTFAASVLDDPETARLMRAAHLAAERGDRLAASSLTTAALRELVRRHARPDAALRSPEAGRTTRSQAAVRARDILHADLVDPPSLAELAAAVGAAPFALLRAFRTAYGLPPHAYLNQERVLRDQAHLTRHFKRRLGVPPGVYQRGTASAERNALPPH